MKRRIKAEEVVGAEWAAWFALTPAERWRETEKLWAIYLSMGGSIDPEPDSQSPFFDAQEWRENSTNGRSGVRVIRRGGI